MKQIICIIILAACLVGFVNLKNTTPNSTNTVLAEGNFEPIAVIELFTSQGCSSCPPADKLLAKTIKNNSGKMVFALSFHVDYWNRLGWVDPFSKAQFSTLQNNYSTALHTNGPYTPQMIVNGKKEFVGSDDEALGNALQNALHSKATSHFKAITTAMVGNKIKIPVALINLKEWIVKHNPTKLLLKIDIEGEEESVIPHILPVLPNTCAIFFETHSLIGKKKILELLQVNKYEVQLIRELGIYADYFAFKKQ